jgi:hypothetical protein
VWKGDNCYVFKFENEEDCEAACIRLVVFKTNVENSGPIAEEEIMLHFSIKKFKNEITLSRPGGLIFKSPSAWSQSEALAKKSDKNWADMNFKL